jgi:2-phospho-L-lactate guanylyltransferase
MSTLAVLPIKSFSEAKQRLALELGPDPRRALAEAMFSDVLAALRRTPELDEIVVVTSDSVARSVATREGVRVREDAERGHSEAVLGAIGDALDAGVARVLLVPGDCPLLDPSELASLLALPDSERRATIVPDRHGTGTNALLLSPPSALRPAFGEGSRRRHVTLAGEAGTPCEVVEVPTLALDVDTPEDLEALRVRLRSVNGGASHTRELLARLDRSGP